MQTFHFRFADHGVQPFIKHLTAYHPAVVSKAINRVVFDIRDAEARMVAQSFDFWSAVTRSFMANVRSFPFEPATPQRPRAKVFAGTASAHNSLAEIFHDQETGFELNPNEGLRLELGNTPASYAVPTKDPDAHLRTPRGRVKQSQTPGGLLAKTAKSGGGYARFKRRRRRKRGVGNLGTHVFVSPNDKAIIEITPGGRRRVLYGLYSDTKRVRPHIHFLDTASLVIGRNMIPKLLQEWDKAFGRF